MRYFVYIMTNATRSVLYTGMTNNLKRRVAEHREGRGSVFTRRYRAHCLVFYESFPMVWQAIAAEKRIKAGSRAKKVALIEAMNPEWHDLSESG